MKTKIFILLGFLAVLAPLGLISESSAWGEWENEYYKELIGYIPKGIENASSLEAPVPDYTLNGFNDIVSYYFSAILGFILLYGIFYMLTKLMHKKQENNGTL